MELFAIYSSCPARTVITREPQYIHPALVSGMLLPPPQAAMPSVEPVPAKDVAEEEKGNMSHGQPPPLFRQVNLSKIREQAGSRLQTQKNKHVRGETDLTLHAYTDQMSLL